MLAYYYHWGEGEILRLSSRKRKVYVEKVSEQIRLENEANSAE